VTIWPLQNGAPSQHAARLCVMQRTGRVSPGTIARGAARCHACAASMLASQHLHEQHHQIYCDKRKQSKSAAGIYRDEHTSCGILGTFGINEHLFRASQCAQVMWLCAQAGFAACRNLDSKRHLQCHVPGRYSSFSMKDTSARRGVTGMLRNDGKASKAPGPTRFDCSACVLGREG
jgi:hypothetical protein